MSQYRTDEPKDESKDYTFADSQVIKKLLISKKLTEKEKQALEHLQYSYNHMNE